MINQGTLDNLRRELRKEEYRLQQHEDDLANAKALVAKCEGWIHNTSGTVSTLRSRIEEVEELLALREHVQRCGNGTGDSS